MFFTLSLLGIILPSILLTNGFAKIMIIIMIPSTLSFLALVPALFFGASAFYESSEGLPRRFR